MSKSKMKKRKPNRLFIQKFLDSLSFLLKAPFHSYNRFSWEICNLNYDNIDNSISSDVSESDYWVSIKYTGDDYTFNQTEVLLIKFEGTREFAKSMVDYVFSLKSKYNFTIENPHILSRDKIYLTSEIHHAIRCFDFVNSYVNLDKYLLLQEF